MVKKVDQKAMLRNLSLDIIINNNIEAIEQYRNFLSYININEAFEEIDYLVLYYIDLVLIPREVRKDFYDLHSLVLLDFENTLTKIKNYDGCYSDMLNKYFEPKGTFVEEDTVLCMATIKTLYYYTDGDFGCDLSLVFPNHYDFNKTLYSMLKNDYNVIKTEILKILFIAYSFNDEIKTMGNDILYNELFEAFIYNKKRYLRQRLES